MSFSKEKVQKIYPTAYCNEDSEYMPYKPKFQIKVDVGDDKTHPVLASSNTCESAWDLAASHLNFIELQNRDAELPKPEQDKTAKELVKDKYPDAVPIWHEWGGGYYIASSKEEKAIILSKGHKSKSEAWKCAYNRMGEYSKDSIFKAIISERNYQDSIWEKAIDRPIDSFASYIMSYAHKLIDLCSTSDDSNEKLEMIRKIAALCVACGEKHGLPKRKV